MTSSAPQPVSVQTPDAEPLSAQEFAGLMAPFGPFPHTAACALAVSGGPDSMALAWCMKHWTQATGNRLMALIVDHGLRPSSATEAKETAAQLKNLGITAEILVWHHPPLLSKIHQQARTARYRLLLDACKRHGIGILLTAHQHEDQGETILMRMAKGSGIDGLAGIAAASTVEDIALLRPLLTVAKDRLIATCKAAQIGFVTDASNLSEKYARGRLRRVLPLLETEGLTIDRLADLGNRAAEARDALAFYTAQFIATASHRDPTGAIGFSLDRLSAVPVAIAARALVAALQSIHPEDYPPEHDAVLRLRHLLLVPGHMAPRTLHGCQISKTATHIHICREASVILGSTAIKPGETMDWDQRWRVSFIKTPDIQQGEQASTVYNLRPLGNPPYETIDLLSPSMRRLVPQGRLRASLPALWQGERLVFIPDFSPTPSSGPVRAALLNTWPPPL